MSRLLSLIVTLRTAAERRIGRMVNIENTPHTNLESVSSLLSSPSTEDSGNEPIPVTNEAFTSTSISRENHISKKKRRQPKKPQYKPSPSPPPQYYFEHGLRKVKPYWYEYYTYAKQRWQMRTLMEVYVTEFRQRSPQYCEWAIKNGLIMVNGEKKTPDYVLKNGDLLTNWMHRHEPPVVGQKLEIVFDGRNEKEESEFRDLFVVVKPGSVPVHSTGRFHQNTMLSILKHDYGLPTLHTANRLDRLTSGVMVCSLSHEMSQKLGVYFHGNEGRTIQKEYVARCSGRFPDGEIVCEEPLLVVDRQVGFSIIHEEGRESRTIFNRLGYDEESNTSIVHCKPITGRTHQIRVHLKHLGHPIANDPVYGPKHVRHNLYEDDGSKNEEINAQREAYNQKVVEANDRIMIEAEAKTQLAGVNVDLTQQQASDIMSARANSALGEWSYDSFEASQAPWHEFIGPLPEGVERHQIHHKCEDDICSVCYVPYLPDPKPTSLYIWLHAWCYSTEDWSFRSQLPEWAASYVIDDVVESVKKKNDIQKKTKKDI